MATSNLSNRSYKQEAQGKTGCLLTLAAGHLPIQCMQHRCCYEARILSTEPTRSMVGDGRGTCCFRFLRLASLHRLFLFDIRRCSPLLDDLRPSQPPPANTSIAHDYQCYPQGAQPLPNWIARLVAPSGLLLPWNLQQLSCTRFLSEQILSRLGILSHAKLSLACSVRPCDFSCRAIYPLLSYVRGPYTLYTEPTHNNGSAAVNFAIQTPVVGRSCTHYHHRSYP